MRILARVKDFSTILISYDRDNHKAIITDVLQQNTTVDVKSESFKRDVDDIFFFCGKINFGNRIHLDVRDFLLINKWDYLG